MPQLDKVEFKLDWNGKRGLYLDNLELKSEKDVVTGVRFTVDKTENENFLKLEIRGTPFDYSTGQLLVDETYWLSLDSNVKR